MADLIQTMLPKDVNSARLAYCYATINNERYLLMEAKNLKAEFKKNKKEVPILGQTGVGHKATGWEGTGSMTVYSVSSKFNELMKDYMDTGTDVYFDMQVVNKDVTSASGSQTVILKNCNIDSATIAAFDADGDWLEQDIDFTFDGWEMPQKYTELDGAKVSSGLSL